MKQLIVSAVLLLLLSSIVPQQLRGQDSKQTPASPAKPAVKSEGPERFESEIKKIEATYQSTPIAESILFLGSSSIRIWDLKKHFPEEKVINAGFGGSQIRDIEHFFDRVIPRVSPRAFVLYTGDNDIGKGMSGVECFAANQALYGRLRSLHPKTPLVWIGVKPSESRWKLWNEMQVANKQLAQLLSNDKHALFVDVSSGLLDEQGKPNSDLFKDDKLHLNELGYEQWSAPIAKALETVLKSQPKADGNTEPNSAIPRDEEDSVRLVRWNDSAWNVQWGWSEADVASTHGRFWPQFRGVDGNGLAANTKIVEKWSETENVLWKIPVAGRAWSSPVVWGSEIWLSNSTDDGKKMSALCIDFETGKVIREIPLFENEKVQSDHHALNSYASPTPLLDREFAYVTFGAYGTACIRRATGEVVWQRRDLPCNHFRGPGSSPVFYKNLIIFHMDGFDFKYVVALDRATGKTVWKVDRKVDYGTDDGDIHKAYSTPLLIEAAGKTQLISTTSKCVLSYNPETGEEYWRVRYKEFSSTARPLFDGTRLYINSGFSKATLIAVRPDGSGDVTDTHVDWRQDRGIGSKPSQLLFNGLIFNVKDDGIASCIDSSNGEVLWQERLGGDFSASPILADGKLYLFDHAGSGYVFLADRDAKQLAKNQLDDGCMASPVAVDGSLILRTRTHLYRIGKK